MSLEAGLRRNSSPDFLPGSRTIHFKKSKKGDIDIKTTEQIILPHDNKNPLHHLDLIVYSDTPKSLAEVEEASITYGLNDIEPEYHSLEHLTTETIKPIEGANGRPEWVLRLYSKSLLSLAK